MVGVPPEEDTFPKTEIDRLQYRAWILQLPPKNTVGAELGVFRGHFSQVINAVLQPRKLFLVDMWTKLGDKFNWGDNPYTNHNRLTTRQALEDCHLRMRPDLNKHIEMVEMGSVEFLNHVRSAGFALDFIYLDTSHDFEQTLLELDAADTVLARDGLILGDDFYPQRNHPQYGVFKAVQRFTRDRPWEIVAAGPAAQWCLRRST